MATRILGPTGSKRRLRILLFLPFVVLAALILAIGASGTVGSNAGFEDADGNLVPNGTAATNCTSAAFDWNCFRTLTWTGTAPYQAATQTTNGWAFNGLTDDQKSTSDTGFAGGTKQDDNCAKVIGSTAPNKDDLIRAYLAHKTVPVTVGGVTTDHVFLTLAFVRIPLNTTSSSAHVGFEFNQNQATNPLEPNYAPCPGSLPTPPGGKLVQRKAGDLLIVYDFEGSSTGIPTLTVRKWIVAPTATLCEVSGKVPPAGSGCWGPAQDLTASGFAEGKVNSGNTVLDCLSPTTDCTSPTAGTKDTLGNAEFGEAGVDLTDAGIFTPGTCLSFGTTEVVSRSSGNSGSAAMEDLVGPGRIRISNCGQIKIIKRTAPRGVNQNFSYTSTIPAAGGASAPDETCSTDSTPAIFTLNDNGNTSSDSAANTENCINVPAGGYTVTEGADPANFVFTDLSCTASGTGTSASPSSGNATRTATITLAGDGAVTCVYTNTQQQGAIKITKTSSKDSSGLDGATFSITKGGSPITGSPFTTANGGVICVDNLAFGDYVVTETGAPTGYKIDDSTGHTVTVDNNAKCSDDPYVGESIGFTDTPLSRITTSFESLAPGNPTSATIQCTGDASSSPLPEGTPRVEDNLAPGTYTCTVVVDP
jgi:hypothetical protein